MSEDQHDFGTLEAIPDGYRISLNKKRLRLGRREGCDIVLNFGNVSGHHALMEIDEGYWFIKDLRSRNGIKVDGKKILQGIKKRLDPNIVIAIAKHEFVIRYDPDDLGASGDPPPDEQLDDRFHQSLLDRAGLNPSGATKGIRPWDAPKKPPPLGGAADPPDHDS